MALIDSEGFGLSTVAGDYLTYSAFIGLGSQVSGCAIEAGGPLGDNYFASINACGLRRLIPSTPSTIITGFRAAFSSAYTSHVSFSDAYGTEQVHVEFSPTGQVVIVRNSTVLATSAAGTVRGTTGGQTYNWVYVEISATISATAGSVTVVLNGGVALTVSGVNTNNASTGTAINFIDWGVATGGNTMPLGLMHIYICDTTGAAPWNTFLGDIRVQTLIPTANNAVQFVETGLASNWQNMANVPPVPASDYNSSATIGQQDTFVMQPVGSNLGAILGVHVKPLVQKSDAGERNAASVLKSGSTTAVGTSLALAITALQLKTLYEVDPNTSTSWTQSAVNLINPGYKVTA